MPHAPRRSFEIIKLIVWICEGLHSNQRVNVQQRENTTKAADTSRRAARIVCFIICFIRTNSVEECRVIICKNLKFLPWFWVRARRVLSMQLPMLESISREVWDVTSISRRARCVAATLQSLNVHVHHFVDKLIERRHERIPTAKYWKISKRIYRNNHKHQSYPSSRWALAGLPQSTSTWKMVDNSCQIQWTWNKNKNGSKNSNLSRSEVTRVYLDTRRSCAFANSNFRNARTSPFKGDADACKC